jgi:hypothetical protein
VRNSIRPHPLLTLTLLLLSALCWAGPAAAQGAPRLRLLVAGAPASGLSVKQAADLVEESAYIADDFGLYAVSRSYQVEAVAGRALAITVERCGGKEACLVPALSGSLFDYVLLVQPVAVREAVEVSYKLLDVRAGLTVSSTLARLPGPVEFAYLLGACQEALKATPDYIAPTMVPAPPLVQQPPPPARAVVFAAEPEDQTPRPYAWLYGSAALMFGSGTLLGFAADDVQQELQARPHTAARVTELQDDGEAKQNYANIAFGVGAAALASGVIFHVLESEDGKRSQLELRTDLRSVSLDWRF